jgi:hypothetical protein
MPSKPIMVISFKWAFVDFHKNKPWLCLELKIYDTKLSFWKGDSSVNVIWRTSAMTIILQILPTDTSDYAEWHSIL